MKTIRKCISTFLLLILATCHIVATANKNEGIRPGWLYASPESVSGGYTSFCQDSEGFLWVGTDNGLLRFDGTSYDEYQFVAHNDGSISDNRILDLLCDSKGRLWVATANGLNLYDPRTDKFTIMTLPNLNFYGYIIAITEQTDGLVTFVVSGVGVFGVTTNENGSLTTFRSLPSVDAAKDFNSLVSGSNGRLYAGTHDGSVYVISPNGQTSEIKVSDDYITGLSVEDDENLLVSDVSNLYRYNVKDNKVDRITTSEKLTINRLSTRSVPGTIYVATSGNGLWAVESGASEARPCADIYSSFLNLSNAVIGAVYCSPEGNLWLGCNYYGIVMVPAHKLPFMYKKIADVFPDFSGGVKALDSWNGNLLVALDQGRIALFSPEGKTLMKSAIPGGGYISSITVVDGNKAIVGVPNDGLWEMSLPDGQVRHLRKIQGKYPKIISVPAGKDELMVSVFGKGVLFYNTKTQKERWLENDNLNGPLFNPYAESMCLTSDNKVWIGLYGGLACYDLDRHDFIPIDQEPFLPGATFDIAECEDGSILVATSHGLIHLDSEKGILRKYTAEDGLLDTDVRKITIDDKGGRWIISQRGLSYLSPDGDDIVAYRGGNGLVETSFNQLEFSDKSGLVYLGSNQGITTFSPDSLLSHEVDHLIRVSGIYLNGKKVTPGTQFKNRTVIEGESSNPKSLHLPYQENALTLRLTTRDFGDASNVQYVWHIDGAGDDWSVTRRGENLIYLPHLDPGRYNLQIKGVENNISSELLDISIHISSPWYMSDIAKIFYTLIIMSMLFLVFILMRKKQEEAENDARIRFFMDISHDIRSPVTLIMSPLESLLKQPFEDDVKAKLKLMYRNCQRILGLVNQLLEIRKLEKGKMLLKCRRTNIGVFISELVEMFRPQASEKGLTVDFTEGPDVPEIWVDRDNFDKIMVNLISNAIKYTPAGGTIEVKARRVNDAVIGDAVEISVCDTGVGLDSKMVARIFDRFYQGEGKDKDGFGIGLDLCKRLVELHHGVITGDNREDGVKGSIFSVRLPVSKNAYSKDELMREASRVIEQVEKPSSAHTLVAPVLESDTPKKSGQKNSLMKRLLVVEDDRELRDYVCSQLGKKYKVQGVGNGAEAMKAIGETVPDLIISDVVMPEVDGLSLLHRLKSNADTHHIPVILLSSKNAVSDRMAGWDRGADAYLGKPFNIDELERLTSNLIDNRLRMKGKFSGVQSTEDVISAPEVKGNDEALMERMMKIIDRNIDDKALNVEKLSQEVGVSRAHLHRKMKDMIGMTPSDFIRTIRLRRACELLQRGDIEVTQVAYALGFTSQPHFSSVFKKFVGVTPSEYRARWEAGKVPVIPTLISDSLNITGSTSSDSK